MPGPQRALVPAALLLLALAALGGCDQDTSGVTTTPEVASVVVTPGAVLITTVGATRALTASALDANGGVVEDAELTWTSDDAAVGTVTQGGVVTAVASGTARISATFEGISAQAELTVSESAKPPILFADGHVITMDPVSRVEEAVLVLGDRVFATGSSGELRDLVGPAALEVDLAGGTVMPGFVDPHSHVYNAVFRGHSEDRVGTTYAEAQERLIRAGTTTMANGNVWPDALIDFLTFVESGELRVRTSVYLGYNDNCGNPWPDGWYLAYPPTRDPEAMFRIPGVKFFGDGGSCNRGAFSFFADGGDLYLTTQELTAAIVDVQQRGYQVAIHALGDITIDTVLAALETALAGGPNTHRHRMEHNRYMYSRQRSRYGEVGAIPVVFGHPFTCEIVDGATGWGFLANDAYAPLRPRFDAWRALIDANPGLRVAWKSDAPTHWPLEPISHLWSLVTRNEARDDGSICDAPDWLAAGAVTVEEALEMMTIDAAYALFMDEAVGSLAAGKFADLIVLSANPLSVAPAALREIEVRMTMIGGKVEFCMAGHEPLCPAANPTAIPMAETDG
ncbi:MAG TPA: amidohydrolase family protein [Longimicrobiales bacterium]|nr:amidohydrolase family protein [Longimicrobiales bacterium]